MQVHNTTLSRIARCGEKLPPMGRSLFAAAAIAGMLPACATTPIVQGTSLSSYSGLTQSDGFLTKSKLHVNKEKILATKTVRIQSTRFPSTLAHKLTDRQRALVANAVDRALCISLSDRFEVVAPDMLADLTVRAVVTRATETDEVAAGLSVAAAIGSKFVDTSVPIPIPRIPIGLGDLAIEAEAIDTVGQQHAAMLWSKGATLFFSSPKVSKVSDAYDLAAAFSTDFAYLMAKGKSPFVRDGQSLLGDVDIIPSWESIKAKMGLAPKYAACENYGRSPGIAGMVGGRIGLPPEWTDSGARRAAQ